MRQKMHWESVYATKAADSVSWYAHHLVESLDYIHRRGVAKSAAVVDIGGGEATLMDDLLAEDYADVAVLDLSDTALEVCRRRLGKREGRVRWLVADALTHTFSPQSIDVWHVQAVFHFLTRPAKKRRIRQTGSRRAEAPRLPHRSAPA